MNATIRVNFLRAIAPGLALAAATVGHAATFTAIDGEGFESPAYSTTAFGTGQLEGQIASTDEGFTSQQWVQSPMGGTSTAVVQTSVVASGSQAVEVNRGANSDDRWAVPVVGYPAERFICIEWDMNVEEATATPGGSFGPFFGIEAYDDDATTILRMGSLGVDAATGDVLVTTAANGLEETGSVVAFDTWYSYRMVLDFATDTYEAFVNDVSVFNGVFESSAFGNADQFTDADIVAIAAGGDAGSQAAVGTAYFDNYFVFETDAKIPEPTTVALLAAGLGVVCGRRRLV